MFYSKTLFRVVLPEQYKTERCTMDLAQLLNISVLSPAWFHPLAAKSWARRHALWPDSKIAKRKHSPCERILRICNLLPNLVLNLSALIRHALRSRMVIQMWPCTWVQVAICATCAMSKDTLLACFSLLDILWATPAGSVISYNIISANISKLSGTENHVLFQ